MSTADPRPWSRLKSVLLHVISMQLLALHHKYIFISMNLPNTDNPDRLSTKEVQKKSWKGLVVSWCMAEARITYFCVWRSWSSAARADLEECLEEEEEGLLAFLVLRPRLGFCGVSSSWALLFSSAAEDWDAAANGDGTGWCISDLVSSFVCLTRGFPSPLEAMSLLKRSLHLSSRIATLSTSKSILWSELSSLRWSWGVECVQPIKVRLTISKHSEKWAGALSKISVDEVGISDFETRLVTTPWTTSSRRTAVNWRLSFATRIPIWATNISGKLMALISRTHDVPLDS